MSGIQISQLPIITDLGSSSNNYYVLVSGVSSQETGIYNLSNLIVDDQISYISSINASQNTSISNLSNWLHANNHLQSGINASQNTSINNLSNWLDANNTLQYNINASQNTSINSSSNLAQAAYDTANTKLSLSGGSLSGTLDINSDLTVSGQFSVTGNTTINGISPNYAPNRPSFRVYGANTTNNLTDTQNGTGALTANNWAVDFTQGSYLNESTGVFTTPVDGLYQVNLVIGNSGYSGGITQAAIVKSAINGNGSGGSVMCMVEFAANSTINHTGSSSIVKMVVGDTLVCKVLDGQINFDSNDNWSVSYIG